MSTAKKPPGAEAYLIGKVLLDTSPHCLEAFSGNALYCVRGMPHMEKYKTVKEVCSLTGLTRKHLYYFHHENVVRAVGYANFSVKDNDGYKLYDDEAVEKLQQIALYYQLGLKRNEIRDMMLSPGYDSNAVLDDLLSRMRERLEQTQLHILALEFIRKTGTKNGLIAILSDSSLEDLGKRLRQEQTNVAYDAPLPENGKLNAEEFEKWLSTGDEADFRCLLGLLVSSLGEGSAAGELTPEQSRQALRYIAAHPEICMKYENEEN